MSQQKNIHKALSDRALELIMRDVLGGAWEVPINHCRQDQCESEIITNDEAEKTVLSSADIIEFKAVSD